MDKFDRDAYQGTNITGRLGWEPNSDFSFTLTSRYRDTKKQYAVNPNEFFFMNPDKQKRAYFRDEHGYNHVRFTLNTLNFQGNPSGWWHYQLNIGYLNDCTKTEKALMAIIYSHQQPLR